MFGGAAAALQMSEYHATGFFAGALLNLLSDLRADAAEPGFALLRARSGRRHKVFACRPRTFGGHDNAERFAALLPFKSTLAQTAVVVEGNLRDQNHVGTPCESGVDCDPTGVASHDLQHHDTQWLSAVLCNRSSASVAHATARIEPERHHRGGQVVVDRFGNADDWDAMLCICCAMESEPSHVADRYQTREAQLLATALVSSSSSVGSVSRLPCRLVAENRPWFAVPRIVPSRADQQAREQVVGQNPGLRRVQQALVTAINSDRLPARGAWLLLRRSNHRVPVRDNLRRQ